MHEVQRNNGSSKWIDGRKVAEEEEEEKEKKLNLKFKYYKTNY